MLLVDVVTEVCELSVAVRTFGGLRLAAGLLRTGDAADGVVVADVAVEQGERLHLQVERVERGRDAVHADRVEPDLCNPNFS